LILTFHSHFDLVGELNAICDGLELFADSPQMRCTKAIGRISSKGMSDWQKNNLRGEGCKY
jgi:hypothetical protein